jgi:hypothetical protein
LLAGGFRDPMVGRDVLVGSLLGAFSIAIGRLGWYVPGWLGHPPTLPYTGPQWQFLGARAIISDLSNNVTGAFFISFIFLFVLFIFRVVLRKEWAAAVACVLLLTFFRPETTSSLTPAVVMSDLITNGLVVFMLLRFGLLAVVVSFAFGNLLGDFPLTTQGSVWYANLSYAGFILIAAVVFYGFQVSLGGRPIFGGRILEE